MTDAPDTEAERIALLIEEEVKRLAAAAAWAQLVEQCAERGCE